MALRLLLVGLVIGLGVDLPSGDEIATWARAGSDWVQARIDGAFGPEAVAEATPTDDAAFAAIVDEMAGTFASDRAAIADKRARASAPDDAAFVAIVDEMAGAFASDRRARGTSGTPEATRLRADRSPRRSGIRPRLRTEPRGAGRGPNARARHGGDREGPGPGVDHRGPSGLGRPAHPRGGGGLGERAPGGRGNRPCPLILSEIRRRERPGATRASSVFGPRPLSARSRCSPTGRTGSRRGCRPRSARASRRPRGDSRATSPRRAPRRRSGTPWRCGS